jgi:hypothetical protein
MTTSKKLAAVDDSINTLQYLQCTHLEMGQPTDKCISETISRLLREKCYLEDKRKQEGNIRTKSLNYMKALFN